jgi:membrane fusion protein (multidrug efflux system)
VRWWRTRALAGTLVFGFLFGCSNQPTEPEAPANRAGNETALRVQVATAKTGKLAARESVSGIVFADQNATIRAEVPGRVVARIAERGQPVTAGDTLVQLDDARLTLALQRAAATLKSSAADLNHANRELRRGVKLKASDTISEKRQDDLRNAVERSQAQVAIAQAARDTADRDLNDATIRAPFDGIVDDWMVDVGDFVAAGAPIAQFVDLKSVRLRAGVTASHASRLAVGQETEAIFSALPESRRVAILKSIGRVANPNTGTYEVELEIDNHNGDLREGMVAKVALSAHVNEEQVLIPRTALLKTQLGTAVFSITDDSNGHPRAVLKMISVGSSVGNEISVIDGLEAGESVVIDGHFALADGEMVIVDQTAKK